MASQEHLDLIKQGVVVWNQWRAEHTDIEPDLSEADFSNTNLSGASLDGANFYRANLVSSDLHSASLRHSNLREAILNHADLKATRLYKAILIDADLSKVDLRVADLTDAYLTRAKLDRADLSQATFGGADLSQAKLTHTNLSESTFLNANLSGADLSDANLIRAHLDSASLSYTHLQRANLTYAGLHNANLSNSDFGGATIHHANLSSADLSEADFSGADLSDANLSRAILIKTNLTGAILTNCSIYGISAWDVRQEGTRQENLVITDTSQPTITVDNLEVAQFIHLLLNNKKLREVIDTIAKKAVLILGRFTPERKVVLEAIREALRTHGYLPILFDFEKPSSRDLTETVSILAHLSRFVIVDLTSPNSVPYELGTLVDQCIVPFQPILHEEQHEFAMLQDLRRRHNWFLPTHFYRELEDLLASLEAKVIEPAEQKVQELEKR